MRKNYKKEEEKKFTTDKTETKQVRLLKKPQRQTPPKIIIDKNLTFNQASYKLEGKVLDEDQNIYVEIVGVANCQRWKIFF